jgi:hypothetical protein
MPVECHCDFVGHLYCGIIREESCKVLEDGRVIFVLTSHVTSYKQL